MNARITAILVILLLVVGGGALYVRNQEGAGKAPGSAGLGQPLLKELKAADIAAIAIRDAQATLTVERKGEQWVLAERDGFPADLDKVKELVVKALELKVGQSEPIGDADRARLNLLDPAGGKSAADGAGSSLEFRGQDGKPLARLLIGKKYFKSEPAKADTAPGDGRYVIVPGNEKQVVLVSDALAQVTTDSAKWIAKGGFAVEKMKSLDVKRPDGGEWRIERSGDNADWKLVGLRAGEKVDVSRANSAASSLLKVDIEDVRKPDEAAKGLDKPTVVKAATLDGLVYTLRIGEPAGDKLPLQVAISGEAKATGSDAKDREKPLTERVARERELGKYAVLVTKSKLDDLLKARAELLEKKSEPGKK